MRSRAKARRMLVWSNGRSLSVVPVRHTRTSVAYQFSQQAQRDLRETQRGSVVKAGSPGAFMSRVDKVDAKWNHNGRRAIRTSMDGYAMPSYAPRYK